MEFKNFLRSAQQKTFFFVLGVDPADWPNFSRCYFSSNHGIYVPSPFYYAIGMRAPVWIQNTDAVFLVGSGDLN